MGKLIWNGWATTWEEVQNAPQRTSIILGRNASFHTAGRLKVKNTIENRLPLVENNGEISEVLPLVEEDDVCNMHMVQVSFPISPGSRLTRDKSKLSNNESRR